MYASISKYDRMAWLLSGPSCKSCEVLGSWDLAVLGTGQNNGIFLGHFLNWRVQDKTMKNITLFLH